MDKSSMLWWIIFGLGSLAVAVAGWLCAIMIHFQDERHIRERDDARKQRDRLNTRNAELVEEVGKLQAAATDPLRERMAAALAESEDELGKCREERQMLRGKLAEALSKPRTVPTRRIDTTKPTRPQKEQEG